VSPLEKVAVFGAVVAALIAFLLWTGRTSDQDTKWDGGGDDGPSHHFPGDGHGHDGGGGDSH